MNRIGRTNSQRLLAFLLAAGMSAAMTGCSQAKETVAEVQKDIFVETQTPEMGNLTLTTDFIGTVQPDELVSVFPKVAGTVLATYYNVGEPVKKGDLLFEIDPVDLQFSVNIAQAQLMAAQAQMDQALGSGFDLQMVQLESQVKSAQNAYSSARQSLRDYNDGAEDSMDDLQDKIEGISAARHQTETALKGVKDQIADLQAKGETGSDAWAEAQRKFANLNSKLTELESTQSMLQSSYNDLDSDEGSTHSSLRTAVRNAQLAYDSSTRIYELTKDQVHNDAIKVANANLGTATASFEAQAHQLEYTKVYSPIDGVIEQRNVTVQTMTNQQNPAYTVSNKATITVTFYVPSDAVAQMAAGDAVTVENGRRSYTGTLTEVGSMVDAQTGLFKVKAVVDCEDGSLLTGLSVKITATTAKSDDSMLIPQSVIYYENGLPYVYLLADGIAVKTPITTGISNAELVEVLSGLEKGAQVISTWHPNLIDGASVTPASGAEPAPEATAPSSAEAASSAMDVSTSSQEG